MGILDSRRVRCVRESAMPVTRARNIIQALTPSSNEPITQHQQLPAPSVMAAANNSPPVQAMSTRQEVDNHPAPPINGQQTAAQTTSESAHQQNMMVQQVPTANSGVATDGNANQVLTPQHQPCYEAEKNALDYAKQKNLAMVMSLLPRITRFDVDDGSSEGTLLHYAAYNGWLGLMDVLIREKKVHPSLENRYDGRTPLLSACRGGRLDAVKYCIKSLKKKYWSATNENGLTCSHFAAREGQSDVLSYIIELSKLADIPLSMQSLKTDLKLQWTPLHYAAANGNTECAVVLLLEAGANPYKRGYKKQSPIDLARCRGDKKMIEIMHDPLKYKIMSMLDSNLGMERKAREKAITALSEDILRLKQALQSIGPKHESMLLSAAAVQPDSGQADEHAVSAEVPKKRAVDSLASGRKSIPLPKPSC